MTTTEIVIGEDFWARPEGPASARIEAEEALAYRPKGFAFAPAYKSGKWDGWSNLYSRKHQRFPAGLAEYVKDALIVAGFDVEVVDHRRAPEPSVLTFNHDCPIDLLPYQEEAVETAVERGHGIIHHPVGTGKSYVLLETVRRLNVPSIALVHTKDLLYQLAKTGEKVLGCQVGIIGDGRWKRGPLTVATFQSIYQRASNIETTEEIAQMLAEFDAVLVDEVHHVQAKTYETVLRLLGNAYYRFGFSATPLKSGDKETTLRVQAWLGPVISHVTKKHGVAAGRLVPADVVMVDPGGNDPADIDFLSAYQSGIVKNGARNQMIISFAQKLRQRGPVLILVERIEHGERLSRELECPFLQGAVSGVGRADKWEDMRRGRLDCAVASVIADEGLDIPNISALVLAGGGKAPHKMIQRIGRGQRRAEGKDRLFVIDFRDRGRYLGRHAAARRRLYEKEPAYTLDELSKAEALELLGEEE